VRLIFRVRGGLIEQRAIWTLLLRIFNVANLPSELEKHIRVIQQLGSGFGRSRNDMLYGSDLWLYDEDFLQPSVTVTIEHDIHKYADREEFFSTQRDANFALAAVLINIIGTLVADIEAQSGVDLLQTSYGHCLRKFDGFNCDKLNSLFATLYRQEGYGINI
jgi:hypothetical protein